MAWGCVYVLYIHSLCESVTPSERSKVTNEITFCCTCSADLLGLLDGPITMETAPQTNSVGHVASDTLVPHVSNDISLLDPTLSSLQPVMSKPQESLALTLFENPVGTIRVPSEYASYPVALGWDNKVHVITIICVCRHHARVCIVIANQFSPSLSGPRMFVRTLTCVSRWPRCSNQTIWLWWFSWPIRNRANNLRSPLPLNHHQTWRYTSIRYPLKLLTPQCPYRGFRAMIWHDIACIT